MRSVLKVLLMSICFSFTATAGEQKICVITSDIDSEMTEMFLDFKGNGDIDSVRLYKTIDGGKVVSDDTHPVERVVSEGIVASERQNRDIVVLKTAKDFSPTSGGVIIMDYLFNGIKNVRKAYQLKLIKSANHLHLMTLDGKQVNHLSFRGNRAPVVGIIGIKEIVPEFK
jgi:hypothetical protein